MTPSDLELLQDYSQNRSETAFAELVNRHLPLVYSAALRQVRSAVLAQEVAQNVFADLARNATRLHEGTVMTAWLYQVTRRTSIDCIRSESRRQAREQAAFEMAEIHADNDDWSQVEPVLDDGMESLEEQERDAILLRYFENKSFREVGAVLGISDDAAQKRVGRAVERLRDYFSKRGLKISTSSFALLISAHATQAVPVTLINAVTSSVFSGVALAPFAAVSAQKIATVTVFQKSLLAITLFVGLGLGIYQTSRLSQLRQNQFIEQKRVATIASGNALLQRDIALITEKILVASQELEQLRRDQDELGKLRNELDRLNTEFAQGTKERVADEDPRRLAAKAWLERGKNLIEWIKANPAEIIPEFQFINESDVLDATENELEEEDDYRSAAADLRYSVRGNFGNLLAQALDNYLKKQGGQLPANLSELKAYSDCSCITDEMLERYQLLHTGNLPSDKTNLALIAEKTPVKWDDMRLIITRKGWRAERWIKEAVRSVP